MKKALVAIVAVVLAGLVAWFVAGRVESPDQVAARAEAPEVGPVMAQLHLGYLHGAVSMAVTAQYSRTYSLKPPSALSGVVSAGTVTAGATLNAGDMLLRVNGRPLWVLPGNFPLYRDMQPGDAGDDVAALQVGLRAAGYRISDPNGVYGATTQAAVNRLYVDGGFTAAPPAVTTNPDGTQTQTGVIAPAAEILMVPELPAIVQSIAAVGSSVGADTELASLGAGDPVLTTTLPMTAIGGLAIGATGTFTDATGAQASATVSAINPTPDGQQVVVQLVTSGSTVPGTQYTIMIENPGGDAASSLLAPITAIVSRGGRSYIYVQDGGGFREVEVTVLGSEGGVAAIALVVADPTITEGTFVRVDDRLR